MVIEKMADVNERDHVRLVQPPVSGEEIMATFGLAPSRPVGDLKNAIKEAVIEGIIPNEHDAAFEYMLELGEKMNLKRVQ
jgi:tRNA nucleotidyltransferase (CCA-adding enzyme)